MAYYVIPKAHWKLVRVGMSIPQQKIRFELYRLPFPVTYHPIEGKAFQALLFSPPEGFKLVKVWEDEDWKGVQLQVEEMDQPSRVEEYDMQ